MGKDEIEWFREVVIRLQCALASPGELIKTDSWTHPVILSPDIEGGGQGEVPYS